MASGTVVDDTIDALRGEIREGRLVPGQRLVIADLTESLGVSAGPVREAIRRLTGEGLIDIIPNRGATVRKLRKEEVAEIFQIREAVEGLAAELAAQKIDAGTNRADLEAERERGRKAVLTAGLAYIDHNQSLHRLIYRIADNKRLIETAEQLTLPIYRMRYHRLMNPAHIASSDAEHAELIDAILSGNSAKAGSAMRHHIRNSAQAMLDALDG